MPYFFSPLGNSQLLSTSGAPLTSGTITTFAAGTSTPQATYADNAGGTPATSLTLNTYGLPTSPVWLKGGLAYKFVVKDALGNTIRTVDNIVGIDDPASFGIAYPSDGTFSFRNRLHNGNFVINQRVVSGTVTLAAGVYGHDRWKAGAGGCTYTFATVGNSTVITITAGTLMQVVEAANVEGGVYTLTHQGSALVRYAVNGGTTSGGFFTASTASPLAVSTATANQTVTVEFTTGTVDRVQMEAGTNATTFERRPLSVELLLCQRYAQPIPATMYGQQFSTTAFTVAAQLPVSMRITPTPSGGAFTSASVVGAGTAVGLGGFTVGSVSSTYLRVAGTCTAIGGGSGPAEAVMAGFLSADL